MVVPPPQENNAALKVMDRLFMYIAWLKIPNTEWLMKSKQTIRIMHWDCLLKNYVAFAGLWKRILTIHSKCTSLAFNRLSVVSNLQYWRAFYRVGYPNLYSIGTHTHTHKHFGFSACMERKLHTLLMCTVCLWKEASCLHLLLAKHCGRPHHFSSKNFFLL